MWANLGESVIIPNCWSSLKSRLKLLQFTHNGFLCLNEINGATRIGWLAVQTQLSVQMKSWKLFNCSLALYNLSLDWLTCLLKTSGTHMWTHTRSSSRNWILAPGLGLLYDLPGEAESWLVPGFMQGEQCYGSQMLLFSQIRCSPWPYRKKSIKTDLNNTVSYKWS